MSQTSDMWHKKTPMGKNTRKTIVKKFKSSSIPKCEMKTITGHNSKQTTTPVMKTSRKSSPTSSRMQGLLPLSSVQTQSRSASSHVFNFSHCKVMLNITGIHSLQSSLSQSKRAYKRIMLQDYTVFCSVKSILSCYSVAETLSINELCFLHF